MSEKHSCNGMIYPGATRRLLLSGIILLFAATLPAGNHYVRPPGTCTNTQLQAPYGSWDAAATNIQWAVDSAMAALPATVWVTNGAYCVTGPVVVTTSVVVRSVSGWTNTTVYSDFPAYTSRCFFLAHGATLDGFTVSNGHDSSTKGGGGIYAISNVIVRNCHITKNMTSNSVTGAQGGGIMATMGAMVSNCLVTENKAYVMWCGGGGIGLGQASLAVNCNVISNQQQNMGRGGGVDCFGSGAIVSNCIISMNRATHGGGGVYAGFITDCLISNNYGQSGCGAVDTADRAAIILNSILVANYGQGGGGIIIQPSSSGTVVSNCLIFGNIGTWIYPGGIYSAPKTVAHIDRCILRNNRNVDMSGGYGGAGICATNTSIRNCLIMCNTNANKCTTGGGVALYGNGTNASFPYGLFNSLIISNYSVSDGGGVVLFRESNYVANCIIMNNQSFSNIYPDVYSTGANSNNFWNCCANQSQDPLPSAQGNITNDPMFADSAYRLNVNSHCINAGLNQAWMTNALDYDCRKRIFGQTVDIGPFERVYSGSVYNFR